MQLILIFGFISGIFGHETVHAFNYTVGNACCQYVNLNGVDSKTNYVLFYGGCKASEKEARNACASYGGFLATVDRNIERTQLATQLNLKAPSIRNAYISTWQTDDYGSQCIALYLTGAITTPAEFCDGPLPFICQFRSQ